MSTFIIFCVLNVLNVIIQTVKSLVTVKCGKTSAALINALAYGLYTVVLVYMNCDVELWQKVAVVSVANLIGVYIVKYFEEKGRKDKVWKIEFSAKNGYFNDIVKDLEVQNISYHSNPYGENTTFTAFANTQEETTVIKNIVKRYNAKYFITETKSF